MDAESAYIFRHVLARDAAYFLQLPSDRARLHALAAELLEELFSGNDAFAAEIADHLANAPSTAARAARELIFATKAARHAASLHREEESAAWWQRCAGLSEGVEKCRALVRAGNSFNQCFQLQSGRKAFDEALLLARALGDHNAEALVLASSAANLLLAGDVAQAEKNAESALALIGDGPDPHVHYVASRSLADINFHCGRTAKAEAFYRAHLAPLEPGRWNDHDVRIATNLAKLCAVSGRREEAHEIYARILNYYDGHGNRFGIAGVLCDLSMVYSQAGKFARAKESLLESIAISRAYGDRYGEYIATANLAVTAHLAGFFDEAEKHYRQALAAILELGDRTQAGNMLGNLGELLDQRGRHAEGEHHFRQGLRLLHETRAWRYQAAHTCGLALCLLAQGKTLDAREHWMFGSRLLLQLGDKVELAARIKLMNQRCKVAGIAAFEVPGENEWPNA